MMKTCTKCGYIDELKSHSICPIDGGELQERAPGASTTTPGADPRYNQHWNTPSPGMIGSVPDLKPLTRIVQVLLVFGLPMAAIAIYSSLLQLELLNRADLAELPESAFLANDNREQLVGISQLILLLITGITALIWIHRANRTCRALGADDMKFTPGWAVGWYFVPFMWLYKPYQAMKEIWRASNNPKDWHNERGSVLLWLWWGLWICSGFFGQLSFRISSTANSLGQFKGATMASIISNAIDLALIPAFLLVVTSVQKRLSASGSRYL